MFHAVDNILSVWRDATDAEMTEGLGWYSAARALAEELDPNDPERAAAVIAVLSPRLSWPLNVKAARDVYAGKAPRVLNTNAYKATALWLGGAYSDYVKGMKVEAFWSSIAHPDSSTVVIDRHAFDIAVGRVTNDEARRVIARKSVYLEMCDAYQTAADILSAEANCQISASDVQAVTWVTWRNRKALSDRVA